MYFKNLFYNPWIGTIFAIIFCIPTFLLLGEKTVTNGEIIKVFCASVFAFVIIYGIPTNIIVSNYKENLKKNLGIRLVKEVKKCRGNYYKFNIKNDEFLVKVKNHLVLELKELSANSNESLDRIDEIDKQIAELNITIEEETLTTSKLIKKHPFIKTLQDVQNRAN